MVACFAVQDGGEFALCLKWVDDREEATKNFQRRFKAKAHVLPDVPKYPNAPFLVDLQRDEWVAGAGEWVLN